MAGVCWTARRFPVPIGRGPDAQLRLEDGGVWDQHLLLELDRRGFSLKVGPNALARVNGQPVVETPLRNGDTIELGSVKIQFWLSGVQQRGLRLRELASWVAIIGVTAAQIGILYWLLR